MVIHRMGTIANNLKEDAINVDVNTGKGSRYRRSREFKIIRMQGNSKRENQNQNP